MKMIIIDNDNDDDPIYSSSKKKKKTSQQQRNNNNNQNESCASERSVDRRAPARINNNIMTRKMISSSSSRPLQAPHSNESAACRTRRHPLPHRHLRATLRPYHLLLLLLLLQLLPLQNKRVTRLLLRQCCREFPFISPSAAWPLLVWQLSIKPCG